MHPPQDGQGSASSTDAWWAERGATRREVMSDWRFDNRTHLEAVLQLEFPVTVAQQWLQQHPDDLSLSYGYVLFAVTKDGR